MKNLDLNFIMENILVYFIYESVCPKSVIKHPIWGGTIRKIFDISEMGFLTLPIIQRKNVTFAYLSGISLKILEIKYLKQKKINYQKT